MMLVMVPAVTVDTKALSELDLLVTKVQEAVYYHHDDPKD
ncbi:hypothetical protein ACU8KH_03786 [Lachancea thermotolerans]